MALLAVASRTATRLTQPDSVRNCNLAARTMASIECMETKRGQLPVNRVASMGRYNTIRYKSSCRGDVYDATRNENTNRLLRQYLPKRTDLSGCTQSQLDKIVLRVDQRPRKTLGFEPPASNLRATVAPALGTRIGLGETWDRRENYSE
jgi:hypothetical protein